MGGGRRHVASLRAGGQGDSRLPRKLEDVTMKKVRSISVVIWPVVLSLIFLAGAAIAAEITLIGEINDTQQLVADNQIYDVGPGELGDYLVTKLISQKVKVVGEVVERDGTKIIIVKNYTVVEE